MSNEKRRYELKARAESQQRTRERIVQATMELHKEVGPAKTTVAEIARRAGVQRLTVYNHFPEEAELFAACQAHWRGLHPLPDVSEVLALGDPIERVREVLRHSYDWYRRTAAMAEKVQRDRGAVPPLDALLARTSDARLAQLAEQLSGGFGARGRRAEKLRALIRLALDFWTWRGLTREGLDDNDAAELMSETIACAALASTRRAGRASA
jgi:AcrR family transcriptional regulator